VCREKSETTAKTETNRTNHSETTQINEPYKRETTTHKEDKGKEWNNNKS
jgi:hypothetical protein